MQGSAPPEGLRTGEDAGQPAVLRHALGVQPEVLGARLAVRVDPGERRRRGPPAGGPPVEHVDLRTGHRQRAGHADAEDARSDNDDLHCPPPLGAAPSTGTSTKNLAAPGLTTVATTSTARPVGGERLAPPGQRRRPRFALQELGIRPGQIHRIQEHPDRAELRTTVLQVSEADEGLEVLVQKIGCGGEQDDVPFDLHRTVAHVDLQPHQFDDRRGRPDTGQRVHRALCGHDLRGQHHVPAGDARARHLRCRVGEQVQLRRQVGDERAGATTPDGEAGRGEVVQYTLGGGPADPVLGTELVLGGEPGTGDQPSGVDLLFERVADAPVQGLGHHLIVRLDIGSVNSSRRDVLTDLMWFCTVYSLQPTPRRPAGLRRPGGPEAGPDREGRRCTAALCPRTG
jgi:hypothetical protein